MIRRILTYRFRRPALIAALCIGILTGIGLARWRLVDGDILWLVMPVWLTMRRRTFAALLVAGIIGCGFGWWRGSVYAERLAAYRPLLEQKVTVLGTATSDAVYGSREQLIFGMSNLTVVTTRASPRPLVGSLSIGGFGTAMVYRGDRVEATGKLLPVLGDDQAGVSFATLRVVRAGHGSFSDTVRRRFAAGMQTALPEPLASFGLGLLVGQRNTLPAPVSQALLSVGLTHIIAVSGYNLTIMLRAARRLCVRRSKFQTATLAAGLTLAFLAVAGDSPSLDRAAIISMLSLAAWYYGREIRPLVLLLVTASASVIANPLYLWGNVSWYLSFLAFFGVVVLAPEVSRRIYGSREPKLITAIAIESLCAEAMTLPYVLHVFGQVSFVALPANILVVIWVPLAMALSLLAGLAGMWAGALAGWFAWPAKLLLGYMLDLAAMLSRVPHAFVQHVQFSLGMLAAAYVLALFITIALVGKNQRKSGIIATNKAAT